MKLDDFMTVGQLAKVSGLSMDAIRRYGDDGLLPPAAVDPSTRYRRYLSAQGSTARLIRFLRDAALPLRAIRRILHREDDPLTVLYEHRDRLVEEYDLLRKRIERIDELVGRPTSLIARGELDHDAIDKLAPDYYQVGDAEVWLEATALTPTEIRRSEDFLHDLFDVQSVEIDTEPEYHSRWLILTLHNPMGALDAIVD